jgi:hypothetical protein
MFIGKTMTMDNASYAIRKGTGQRESAGIHPWGERYLIEDFDWFKESIGFDTAYARVQRLQIKIIPTPTEATSFCDILSALDQELGDALNLVSLFGHKRVDWYEARAEFIPSGEDAAMPVLSAYAKRIAWLGFNDQSVDLSFTLESLVQTQALEDGVFQQVLSSYQKSNFKTTLKRAILALLTSFEQSNFEAHLGHLYSALETLVDGLDADGHVTYLLGSSRFDRFAKKVRSLVRDEITEPDIQDGVIKKIAELRRRSFVDRLDMLLNECGLDVRCLWAPGSDPKACLQAIIKRRDLFIHQGKIGEGPHSPYGLDSSRLTYLIELWLLKLIGYPDLNINHWIIHWLQLLPVWWWDWRSKR